MSEEVFGRRTLAAAEPPRTEARWIAEAERLHRRYQVEIVESLGLCPWAARARLDDAFRARVLLQTDTDVAATLEAIDAFDADARVDVAVVVYPRFEIGRVDFEGFVAQVRQADVARHPVGRAPFVSAAFHPGAMPDNRDAERLIPFLRRTPDPTIQLLRSSLLDRVRAGTPQGTQFIDARTLDIDISAFAPLPLRERIARANQTTVARVGIDELMRRFDDIADDRARTYRALDAGERVP